jgi:alkanesulfonate monooxygenase SsuD/methylene tetrahydromethanopterin reductase-like flavin-dependent oxidoreductase (luciferase family)
MVDRLLHGRLNLGFGSGYIPLEFEGHGVDPSEKRERFDRAYDAVLSALRGEAVRSNGSSTAVRINVRPVQTPTPPIWIAVQRREAIPFVARRGVSVALVPYATLDSVDELADEVREFRANLPDGARAGVSAAVHLYVGRRPERARAALQRYLDSRLATQSAFLAAKVRKDPAHARAETLEDRGFALLGSRREVLEGLDEYRTAGVDEVLGIFDFGGLPIEDAQASVAAIGPEFAR